MLYIDEMLRTIAWCGEFTYSASHLLVESSLNFVKAMDLATCDLKDLLSASASSTLLHKLQGQQTTSTPKRFQVQPPLLPLWGKHLAAHCAGSVGFGGFARVPD